MAYSLNLVNFLFSNEQNDNSLVYVAIILSSVVVLALIILIVVVVIKMRKARPVPVQPQVEIPMVPTRRVRVRARPTTLAIPKTDPNVLLPVIQMTGPNVQLPAIPKTSPKVQLPKLVIPPRPVVEFTVGSDDSDDPESHIYSEIEDPKVTSL